jgi:cysteine desulfuration protein SufE
MNTNENGRLKSIRAVEEEIIDEFQEFEDVDAKYIHLFQLGADMPTMNPALKTDQNFVKGCQSKLWFHLTESDGKLTLSADSDSLVIKAIAALLARIVEGRSPAEIENISMDFIDQLQIWKLASERNNGLIAMLDHIKDQAEKMTGDRVID